MQGQMLSSVLVFRPLARQLKVDREKNGLNTLSTTPMACIYTNKIPHFVLPSAKPKGHGRVNSQRLFGSDARGQKPF